MCGFVHGGTHVSTIILLFFHILSTTTSLNPTRIPTIGPTFTPSTSPTAVPLSNYCDRLAILANISNPTYNAVTSLGGMTVTIGINLDAPPQWMKFDPISKAPIGGYLYMVHNEMSKRGNYNIRYKVVQNISSFPSTDLFLNTILHDVDVFGSQPITDTDRRREVYTLDFTRQIVDNSVILVSPGTVGKEFILFGWLQPFSNNLWLLMCGMFIVYGVIWYVYELLYRNADNKTQPLSWYIALYDSFLAIAYMDSEERPDYLSALIVRVGFKWMMQVVLAYYLANYANILLAPPLVTTKVVTIFDAVRNHLPICALNGANNFCTDCSPGSGTPYSIVNATYPTLNLVPISSNNAQDLLISMNTGLCVGAVMTTTEWDFWRNTIKGNPICNLVQTKDTIRVLSGSFPLNADFGAFGMVNPNSRCASCVALVMSAILSDMRGDGTLSSLYKRARGKVWDQTCAPLTSNTGDPALTPADMAGIIVIYIIPVVISLLLIAFGPYLRQYYDRWKGLPEDKIDRSSWGSTNIVIDDSPIGSISKTTSVDGSSVTSMKTVT